MFLKTRCLTHEVVLVRKFSMSFVLSIKALCFSAISSPSLLHPIYGFFCLILNVKAYLVGL